MMWREFSPRRLCCVLVTMEPKPASFVTNTSSGRSSRASQSPTKAQPAVASTTSSSASAAQVPIPQLTFPLQNDYDFKLACKHCFTKLGEGVKGYKYDSTAHQCMRDVLILKKQNTHGISWIKIRPRPDTKGHFGGYKVCTQFKSGKACKVSEEKCTFPHTEAEQALWSEDRAGTFSINNFISVCKQYKICKLLFAILENNDTFLFFFVFV